MPGRFLLLLLMTLLSDAAAGPAAITMELTAGLGGQAVTRQASEIAVQLFARLPLDAELEILDANGRNRLPVQLNEQQTKTLWITLTPKDSDTPVRIRLYRRSADNSNHNDFLLEKQLRFTLSDTPLTLVSSRIPASGTLGRHLPPGNTRPVILTPDHLPHSPRAYAGIHALVIEPVSLASLSPAQYRALGHYLKGCGILLLSQTSESVLNRVRSIAGCHGDFVQPFTSLSRLSQQLSELRAAQPPKLPGAKALAPLLQNRFKLPLLTSISLYLGGYILFMALLGWQLKQQRYLLLLPLLASAAGAFAWRGEPGQQQFRWTEAQSGDRFARSTALLLLGGERRGEARTTINAETQLTAIPPATPPAQIDYQTATGQRQLSAFTPLLSPRQYRLDSIQAVSTDFQLSLSGGLPVVTFNGAQFPPGVRLLWQGHRYPLPALARGQRWQPAAAQAQQPDSAAERLLNRRLAFNHPALLLPLTGSAGWLVIRHQHSEHDE